MIIKEEDIPIGDWWAINGAIWSAFGFMYLTLMLFGIAGKVKKKNGVVP